MANIEDVIRRQRGLLIRGVESPLFQVLSALYGGITPALLELAVRLSTSDDDAPLSAVVARQRAAEMAQSAAAQLAALNPDAISAVQRAQLAALARGTQQVPEALRALLPAGTTLGQRVNVVAVERAAAAVLPGSPLADLFASLPAVAGANVSDVFLRGVLLGKNPRRVAADLRHVLNGAEAQAETIARTEVLRAYRGAAQEGQRANADVLGGWVWISSAGGPSRGPCSICWAMHGTIHPLDEPFASHPNCRCSPAPLPRTLPPEIQQGEAMFAALPEDQQRAILGPGRHALYRDGVPLGDMVGRRDDPRWGPVRHQRSIREIRAARASAQSAVKFDLDAWAEGNNEWEWDRWQAERYRLRAPLDAGEREALQRYKGAGAFRSNAAVRSGEAAPELAGVISAIDKGEITGTTILNRAVKDPRITRNPEGLVGTILPTDPAPLSTTTIRGYAANYADPDNPVVVRVLARPGQRALAVPNSNEAEVLLPPNTRLRVVRVVPSVTRARPTYVLAEIEDDPTAPVRGAVARSRTPRPSTPRRSPAAAQTAARADAPGPTAPTPLDAVRAQDAARQDFDAAVDRTVAAQAEYSRTRSPRARDEYDAAVQDLGAARARYQEASLVAPPPERYVAQATAEAAMAEGRRLGIAAEYITKGADSRVMPQLHYTKGWSSPAAKRDLPRVLNEINAEVNRLQIKYPAARATRLDTLALQRGSGRAHVSFFPTDPAGRGAMRLFVDDYQDVTETIRSASGTITRTGEERVLDYIARKGHMHGTTLTKMDTVRHEFAHALTYRAGIRNATRIERSWKDAAAAASRDAGRPLRGIIGEYGTSNVAEGMAETLAIFMHPHYGTPMAPRYFHTGRENGRLPDVLEDWCRKVLSGEIS